MSSINFSLNWAMTPISSIFIEEYMTMPNYPVYSLVYIYALKKAVSGEALTNESIAEHFQIMESEVTKIWKYWETAGLIKLRTSGDQLNIEFLTPNSKLIKPAMQQTTEVPKLRRENKPVYNPEDIRKLSEQDDELSGLLAAAQTLLNKPLSLNDVNTIVGFCDKSYLGLPSEVIYVLLSYCGSHNKGIRYMEKVALDWFDKGINDQDSAEDYLNMFLNEYKKIMRYYGISDRSPSESEQAFMSSWVKKLNMPLEIIKEACKRTIDNTGKASFPYTNTILNNWYNAGVKNIDDIKSLDAKHSSTKPQQSTTKKQTARPNFDQREYDKETLENAFNKQRNN